MGAFLPKEQRRQVEALLRDGLSDREVHRRTGVGRMTVARYRKRLGLSGWQASENSPTCRHGHPFPEDAARDGQGRLYCRGCQRDRQRARYVRVEPDAVAVERAVLGDAPEWMSPRERHAAILRMTRSGLSAATISERLRCSTRTVFYARSKVSA